MSELDLLPVSLIMEQFKRFEEEFINSSRIIGRSMRNLENANGNVDLVIAASVEIEGELSECEGYLKAMEIEYRNLGQLDKKSVQGKVNEYKEEYTLLNSRYTQSKFNAESLALKGGNNARNKLLNANQRLDQSTATLEQARMLVAQTENQRLCLGLLHQRPIGHSVPLSSASFVCNFGVLASPSKCLRSWAIPLHHFQTPSPRFWRRHLHYHLGQTPGLCL